ncbi:hypothetical protein [Streptomyces sp. NPDC090025]|uniref:hypothetical protein n=1 Tax=Streptomyces sp. NPDC090025 TaxID=3365922 RepID=UPI0038355A56
MELLRSLDRVPTGDLKRPDDIDFQVARERAARLQIRLSADLGVQWSLNDRVQDASYGIELFTEIEHLNLGIRISNYGDLAVVTTPSPSSHSDLDHAVNDGILSAEQRRLVETALHELGYTLVPLPLLRRRYDGVTGLAELNADDHVFDSLPWDAEHPTWWTRYFAIIT